MLIDTRIDARTTVVATLFAAASMLFAGAALARGPFSFDVSFGQSARIGVEVQPMTPELRDYFDAPDDRGVLVVAVEDDSPAERAGLRVGDVIAKAGNAPVREPRDLRRAIADAGEGVDLELELVRQGDSLEKTVTPELGEGGGMSFDLDDFTRRGRDELEQRVEQLERRLRELERTLRRELDLRAGPQHRT